MKKLKNGESIIDEFDTFSERHKKVCFISTPNGDNSFYERYYLDDNKRGNTMNMAISLFIQEYGFLSNFYPCEVKFEGLIYPSVEHAYQAAKMPSVPDRLSIRRAETAAQAKKIGRIFPIFPDWNKRKEKIMFNLLKQKFKIRHLSIKLKATGNNKLIEGNYWHDNFWGDCFCGKCQNIIGQNKLGILLEQVREIVINSKKYKMNKTRYDPKKEQKLKDGKRMWEHRVENFDVTHQIEWDKFYKQTRYAFLVTGNGGQWAAISVLGKKELLALQKEINKVVNNVIKPKRVLKRRK